MSQIPLTRFFPQFTPTAAAGPSPAYAPTDPSIPPSEEFSHSAEVILIPLSQLQLDPDRPRRALDEEPLCRLASDIIRRGCLQPLLVRSPSSTTHELPSPDQSDAPHYVIINGARRFHVAELFGLSHLPCLLRPMSDLEAIEAQMVDNILLEDLDPVEKGLALRSLYDLKNSNHPKYSWDDIARSIGLSPGRVAQLVRLATLPPPILTMVQRGELSSMHALVLSRLNAHPQDQLSLARLSLRKDRHFGLTCSQLRTRVQETIHRLNPPDPLEKLKSMANRLSAILNNTTAHRTDAAARALLEQTACQLTTLLEQISPVGSPTHPGSHSKTCPIPHPDTEHQTPDGTRVGAHPPLHPATHPPTIEAPKPAQPTSLVGVSRTRIPRFTHSGRPPPS